MLNYRHLYYFWMVSKEGGFARAARRLDMAVQTISVQVHELEESLGLQLFKPLGRGVVLTEAGQVALNHAEGIFQMGKALVDAVQDAATGRVIRFAVGLSDGISKLAAHALLGPILDTPDLRLICHEGEFEQLQAELALHSLDLVLAGQPAPDNPNLRLVSDRLVSSPVAWYCPAKLLGQDAVDAFPWSLESLPVLLPTGHSALRASLDHWLHAQGLRVRVASEFEDSALMSVFAAWGLGVFPISRLGADDLGLMPGLLLLGCCEGVNEDEDIYAIRNRRGQHHPLVQRLSREMPRAR
ncbi:MAG: LysR family transcriptional regulator [Candidatus Accumulibacter sp.]|jgi:LysR family transcriptional activator of nhaA|nr:LysR family transcriptional regulator [Accumulibacter sp.]